LTQLEPDCNWLEVPKELSQASASMQESKDHAIFLAWKQQEQAARIFKEKKPELRNAQSLTFEK